MLASLIDPLEATTSSVVLRAHSSVPTSRLTLVATDCPSGGRHPHSWKSPASYVEG